MRRKAIGPLDINFTAGGVVALRMISSLAWLDSALLGKDAKFAPDFFSGAGLSERVITTFVHTALTPALATFLRNTVVPHAQTFAVLIAVADLTIGISLLLGFLTRLGGSLAILRAVANVLMVGGAGTDTIGFNAMLATAGAIAIVTGAGRRFGLDRMLLSRYPSARLIRLLA